MATRTVNRRSAPLGSISGRLLQYLTLGNQEKEIKKRRDDIKKDLLAVAEQDHEEDPEKGHLLHTLPEAVEVLGHRYLGFMKQRKVSQVFLEDQAEALCQDKGFDPDEYTTRYVDQDKIVRLYAEDRITQEEFDSLYETNESWAFVAVKE